MSNQIPHNLHKLLNTFSIEDIKTICEPLKLLGIHHFHFSQIFNDGSRISICSNKDWIERFYVEELFSKAYFFKFTSYYNCATVWYDVNESETVMRARDAANITNNGISIAVNKLDSCRLYHFSSLKPEYIHQLASNNFELLYRFIDYFHENSHQIIKEALKNKLAFPKKTTDHQILIAENDIELFKKNTHCSKFYIDEYNCYLSQREFQIIRHYTEGQDCNSIAKSTYISPRTVQTHINNVKTKLHCKKTSELIRLLHKINLLN